MCEKSYIINGCRSKGSLPCCCPETQSLHIKLPAAQTKLNHMILTNFPFSSDTTQFLPSLVFLLLGLLFSPRLTLGEVEQHIEESDMKFTQHKHYRTGYIPRAGK